MPVLNTADTLKLGTLDVSSAYLGTELVWELEESPVNTVAPAVTGGPSIGSTLTCSTGTWANSPTSYAYQWQRNSSGWTNISGATSSTLDTTGFSAEDIRCQVTASNAHGSSAPANSNTVTLTTGTPRIFGANDITGATGPNSANRLWASKFTKTHAGAITAISANFVNPDGAGNTVKVVAMADNAGAPGTVLWVTTASAVPSGTATATFALPADVSGTNAAGTYWLGVVASDYQGGLAFGAKTGIGSVLVNGFSFASPPSTCPAPSSTYGDTAAGVWCDYIG